MAFVLTFFFGAWLTVSSSSLLVSFLIFTLLRIIPGDPVRVMLGQQASEAALEIKANELGLRDLMIVQYGRFLWWRGARRLRRIRISSANPAAHHPSARTPRAGRDPPIPERRGRRCSS